MKGKQRPHVSWQSSPSGSASSFLLPPVTRWTDFHPTGKVTLGHRLNAHTAAGKQAHSTSWVAPSSRNEATQSLQCRQGARSIATLVCQQEVPITTIPFHPSA